MYVFGLLPVLVVVPSCDGTAALVRLVASFSVHCLGKCTYSLATFDTVNDVWAYRCKIGQQHRS